MSWPFDRTEDADAALASVLETGGRVVVAMHDYPGGRRFTFADPSSRDYFPITSVEDLWIRMHLGLQTDITTIIGSSPDTA